MKLRILFLSAIFAMTQLLPAQNSDNRNALGFYVTKAEYKGDLGNDLWKFGKNKYFFNWGGALNYQRYLNKSFDWGLQAGYGEYDFINPNILANRFISKKYDAATYFKYKFNNDYILGENVFFAPFLTLGVGGAGYQPTSNFNKNPMFDLTVPVGAGVKFRFTSAFAIEYKYVYNFTSRDNRDFNTSGGKNDFLGFSNDAYGQHFLGLVFSFGSKDTDKDGVKDKADKCPDTPLGVTVDAHGCPVDSDGDGVPDYLDKCSNTPAGVQVDAHGCPLDGDGDGVADYLDKCPNTPAGVQVDVNGCPLDSDGDGVADYLDKCPNTTKGLKVDAKGCPIDSDGDGVPDYLDKCPNTPAKVQVDANGCPLDKDGDGVPDYLDKCPDVPGIAANKGCPEVKAEVKKIFAQALQGIQFETGKDVIRKQSFPILDKVVKVMNDNPVYNLEINGHTDSQGNDAYNQELSDKRASSVMKYLIDKGVSAARLTAKGFGESQPVADNKTAKGRYLNRRVEFKVNF